MPGMLANDILQLTGVADPRLSPDGTTIAYVVTGLDGESNEYRGTIWLAALDGSSPPRRLTAGTRRDADPRWSPDGTRLAFTSNRNDETMQLYVMPVSGGEAQRLTALKEDVTQAVWSPDGATIAFVVARARRRLRRKRRQAPRAAQVHPAALQVRAHRLDRRPAGAPLHRAGRRFRCLRARSRPARSRTRRRPGRPTAPPWPSSRRARPTGTSTPVTDHLPDRRVRRRRRAAAPDAGRRHGRAALVVARRRAPRRAALPGRLRRPAAHAGGRGRRRKRRPDPVDRQLDRNCSTYPSLREPLWDGANLVFVVEDHGNVHLYRVRADGSAAPELLAGRRARGDRLRPGRRAPRARRHRAHHGLRAVRPRGPRQDAPPDPRRRRLRRRPRARRAPALHGGLGRRHRGRGLGHQAGRRQRRREVPGAAEHPRRPLHAVRQQALRRVPGRGRSRLCRRLL